jgi:cytochrome c556
MRSQPLAAGVMLVCTLVTASACRRADQPAATAAAPAAPAQPTYIPDATVKDLMVNIVDTSADVVWLSVTTEVNEKGIVDTRPQNDEEWLKVRQGAITLAEAANLLMIPGRHVARAGEKSETPGIELEPAEMEELINKDRATWNARATALHDAAMLALRAAESHDADKIFEIGETIEHACETCHKTYWYPNEKLPQFPTNTAG